MSVAKKALFIVASLLVLLGLDFVFTQGLGPFKINEYIVRIIMLIGINITLAVSLNIINGMAGQFSIGHAGFMAVGGYAAAYVTCFTFYGIYGDRAPQMLANNEISAGVSSAVLALGLLAGAIAAAIAGLAVGIPSLRLKGDYLAIVTLGFGEIIRVIIQNIQVVGGNTGFTGLDVAPGVTVPVKDLTNFFWVFAVALLTIVIARNIMTSTFGRALAAIREDEIAAEAMGVNTTYYKVVAFALGSALAGVAGGLSGHLFGNLLNPASFTFVKSIEVVIMIVLGGIGSITGAVFGAGVLTILPEALRYLGVDQQYPGLRMVIYSLLLILMMMFRPQGILGRREIGWHWIRRQSKNKIPVALTEGADAAPGTDASRPTEDSHSDNSRRPQ